MIERGAVHAIIPSRGNVDMTAIVKHLQAYPEIGLVSIECGWSPFNRYLAAARSESHFIYTQDDDCITDLRPLFDEQDRLESLPYGASVNCWQQFRMNGFINAMTKEHAANYPGAETLLGFGALFDRLLIQRSPVVDPFEWKRDSLFLRESDRVFGTIHDHDTVFPKIEILPCANEPYRFWKQSRHCGMRDEIRERIRLKTGIASGGL